MKPLRCISTAVLLCLALAAPATAVAATEPEQGLTASANGQEVRYEHPVAVGTPVTWTFVNREFAAGEHYLVDVGPVVNGSGCMLTDKREERTIPPNGKIEISETLNEPVGAWHVCIFVPNEHSPSGWALYELWYKVEPIVFVIPAPVITAPVVAPPGPIAAPVAPVATPPTSTPPVVAPPITKPESKLTKALKQCKKLKKHSKRVACEKRAKKRYKR
jgi:hypothetical protein